MINNLDDFIREIKSVTICTLDEKNFPFSSYAPYLKNKNKYYIFISEMAKHTHNLRRNNKASIFFIEDEKDCKNIFARKRATIQCEVNEIKKLTDVENHILDLFESKFDENMIKTLRQMNDFYLFEFTPIYGEVVLGFGKAYNLDKNNFNEFTQRKITSQGHGSK